MPRSARSSLLSLPSSLLLLVAGCSTQSALDASTTQDAAQVDAGPDAFSPDSPDAPEPVDAVAPRDAFYMPSCEPMEAETDLCFAGDCAGVTGAYWNGSECVESRCDCIGSECGIFTTKAACDAAHAMCDAARCTSTGGAWYRVPAWCGHFVCGRPNSATCETPTTACDCGRLAEFVEGVGCRPDPECSPFGEMIPEDTLCALSGGTWRTDICGHATCGRLSDADCVSPGCVCARGQVFDMGRGCVPSSSCETRLLGEDCTETGLCGAGSACCSVGGGSAERTCVAPMCGSPEGVCGPARP